MTLLLATHALATIMLTGLIWFVQVVHYPLMARVGAAVFTDYAARHVRRTTLVAAPLMVAELGTAVWLALAAPHWATVTGLLLCSMIWLATFALQVPCHRKLEHGLDLAVARRLVATNWVRTLAWTARAVLALWLLGTPPTAP